MYVKILGKEYDFEDVEVNVIGSGTKLSLSLRTSDDDTFYLECNETLTAWVFASIASAKSILAHPAPSSCGSHGGCKCNK